MPTIAQLSMGQRAVITEFNVEDIPIKLLELGCLPGNTVELVQQAPFRDPLYINLNGSHLAIRKDTAAKIHIEIL